MHIDSELLERLSNNDVTLTKLDLTEYGYCPSINDTNIQALAQSLMHNTTLITLKIPKGRMGIQGIQSLAKILTHNSTLTSLSIVGNTDHYLPRGMVSEEVKCLSLALKGNRVLKVLDLSFNLLGDTGVKDLSLALKDNYALTMLNLSCNSISSIGVEALRFAIEGNSTLRSLNLSYNPIYDKGAKLLSLLLKNNSSLRDLNLNLTKISDEGIADISLALKENYTLATLDLSANYIGDDGAKKIGLALKENYTLTELTIDHSIEKKVECFNSLLKRNLEISTEKNPIRKANLIGKIKGKYQVPSLFALGLFTVKKNASLQQLEKLKSDLPEEVYQKLINY